MSKPRPARNTDITPTEAAVLSALIDYIDREGVPPTYDDLHPMTPVRRRSDVHLIVQELIGKGYVRKDERLRSRNIWPVLDPLGIRIGGRAPGRPPEVRVVRNRLADQAVLLLRAAAPVLIEGAQHIPDDEHKVPLLRLADTIQKVLAASDLG